MKATVSRVLSAAVLWAAAFVSPALAAEKPDAPTAPFKIGEGLYYVGSVDYASYLIVDKAGKEAELAKR